MNKFEKGSCRTPASRMACNPSHSPLIPTRLPPPRLLRLSPVSLYSAARSLLRLHLAMDVAPPLASTGMQLSPSGSSVAPAKRKKAAGGSKGKGSKATKEDESSEDDEEGEGGEGRKAKRNRMALSCKECKVSDSGELQGLPDEADPTCLFARLRWRAEKEDQGQFAARSSLQ